MGRGYLPGLEEEAVMDNKPGRFERFARCLDAVTEWLRRLDAADPQAKLFGEGDAELLASDVLRKTSQAMFLCCRGDVLDCLEDAEESAERLRTKEAPDAE